MPLILHYTKGQVKREIGLARGKKVHDKRGWRKTGLEKARLIHRAR
ncbi:MAG: hypothetical protein ON057_000050 [Glomeribacter sp. 1016415]|nr:hypothetical protein [Glomeribacter sp. 1016415]